MIRPALWILLGASFVFTGARGVALHLEKRPLQFGSATATTDELASQLLHIEHGTSALSDAVGSLSDSQPILLVGPADEVRFSQIFYLISYIAWPRPVWAIGEGENGNRARYAYSPKAGFRPAAVIYFETQPPGQFIAQARRIANNLTFVRLPERAP